MRLLIMAAQMRQRQRPGPSGATRISGTVPATPAPSPCAFLYHYSIDIHFRACASVSSRVWRIVPVGGTLHRSRPGATGHCGHGAHSVTHTPVALLLLRHDVRLRSLRPHRLPILIHKAKKGMGYDPASLWLR